MRSIATFGSPRSSEKSDLPDDEGFREAIRSHVESGSKVALQNSNAETDDQLYPLHEVPRWTWSGDNAGA
jgi:hemoglobin